jgi:hypothetical protein
MNITAPPRRMPVRQAAAIWTVVFLIGLTGGELLRQQTLDGPALASTTGPTEPTAALSASASEAAVPSGTYTATTTTTPPQTTTMVECDGRSCPDHPGKQESGTEDGESGRAHGKGGKGLAHGKGDESGAG